MWRKELDGVAPFDEAAVSPTAQMLRVG